MSLTRVHNFSISLDGFGTGDVQSADAPFGHAGARLHEWMFGTRFSGEMVGEPGGTRGLDDAFARQHGPGIGAEIMGAAKFGPPGWPEDPEWKGWWGGGATTIREFVAAGLVDHMHVVVVPIMLGRGVRLWDGLEGIETDHDIEATSSPSGVMHLTFTRAAV